MVETVETVFGDAEKNIPRSLPDEVIEAIKKLRQDLEIPDEMRAELKARYVELLNRPAIQAQGDGRWVTAFRALRAWYQGLAFGQGAGHDFLFVAFSSRKTAFKNEERGTWAHGLYGIAKSLDPKFEFEGPTDVQITGFTSQVLANQYTASIQMGVPYKIRANPSQTSPVGKLANGQTGWIFVDGGRPFEPHAKETLAGDWADPVALAFNYYPKTQMGPLLTGQAKANQKYVVEGEIVAGRTGANKEDNSPWGTLTLTDDSVTTEIAKNNRGGLFAFVPKAQVALANLPSGSRVAAIVDGYLAEQKDKSGASTGEAAWKFNIHALKPIIDLSAGTTIPNPQQPAVSIGAPKKGLDI